RRRRQRRADGHASVRQDANGGRSESNRLGLFSDPGVSDRPWAVDVDLGDGSLHSAVHTDSQGPLRLLQPTLPDKGVLPVQVTGSEKDGGSGTKSFKITVANVAPTVTAPSDQSSSEGSSHSFDLGSFSDPGAFDNPWDVTVSWGDGSPDTTLAFSSRGAMGTTPHTYDDNGPYTVTVTVKDKDHDSGSAQFTVTVANVPPTADLANGGPVGEGSPASVSFSNANDPSGADTTAGFHYAFACDDGSL